jgi:hypothetical protein
MKSFPRPVFNDENIALMRAMVREGKSASQIADKIGSTPRSVRVLASRLGIRFRLRISNDENIALMRMMAQEGKSASQIADRIGSTAGSVRVLASRLGIRLGSRNKDKASNDLVQMSIVLSRRAKSELSTLARKAGLKSAAMLVRQYLEELAGGSGDHHATPGGDDPAQNDIDTAPSSTTGTTDEAHTGKRGALKRTGRGHK